jgi:hypothetical protein
MRNLTSLGCSLLLALAGNPAVAETPQAGAPDAEAVLKALRSPDADERIAAGRALYDVTNLPATTAATLVEALGDRYSHVRAGSAAAAVRRDTALLREGDRPGRPLRPPSPWPAPTSSSAKANRRAAAA